ncbi:hypothetical protein RN001_009041 [Aquatica leii]|uniref:Uncharacterized protein n=1 Tax=Aquatica leii TaxID=1421715 RepID=A0AAN7NZ29_9COLE|nr:hypothetical protein RN001_009041 [Aquatica leii]
MVTKIVVFVLVAVLYISCSFASFGPTAFVAPYATSYSAHVVNHAVAAPIVAPYGAYAAYSAYPYAYTAPYYFRK